MYVVRTTKVANFQQYVERHFLTFVQSMISESTITRPDFIWDSHPDQSLPRLTHEKDSCRTKIYGSTPIPGVRLEQFLKTPENKAGLIRLICQDMVSDLITFPKYYNIFHQERPVYILQ